MGVNELLLFSSTDIPPPPPKKNQDLMKEAVFKYSYANSLSPLGHWQFADHGFEECWCRKYCCVLLLLSYLILPLTNPVTPYNHLASKLSLPDNICKRGHFV